MNRLRFWVSAVVSAAFWTGCVQADVPASGTGSSSTDTTAVLPIGAACDRASACGPGRLCVTEQAPGGYCTQICTSDADCGLAEGGGPSRCLRGSTGERWCQVDCTAGAAACRRSEGYRCEPVSTTLSVCEACVPRCDGRACGDDGCGRPCDICTNSGEGCDRGVCRTQMRTIGRLPRGRYDASALTWRGEAVLIGGREDRVESDGTRSTRGTSRVERWSAQTQQIVSLPSLPQPLAAPPSTDLDGVLYVAGGTVDPDDVSLPVTASSRVYRLQSAQWEELSTAVPVSSQGASLAAVDGRLLLTVGLTESGVSDRTLWFDPATSRWTEGPRRSIARSHMSQARDGRRLFLAGGWDGTRAVGTVEVFDPEAGWEVFAALPVPVVGAHAVVADGALWVFGGLDGIDAGDSMAVVQRVDLTNRHTLVAGTLLDGRARQAAAVLPTGEVLLAGGYSLLPEGVVALDAIDLFVPPVP